MVPPQAATEAAPVTEPAAQPVRARRPARADSGPKRRRGEGQWALGYREPLNPNERSKKDDDPLNVRARIESIYSQRGFDSIDPADLRGRFRWMGLYTQRKPGIDGGRTGSLTDEELDDRYFMMRVRIDSGGLTTDQLRVVGEISRDYARDTADITDRQNVQYHWIQVEDVPRIWEKLENVGLTTLEACGDCPRVVLGSPVAGIAADEIVDGTPAINEIVARYVGNKEFSNLPRKFKSAISGSPRHDVVHEINDIAFVGVRHPEHGPGFDVWVGGGLSTNPKIGQRLGAWVPLDEVPDVWAGVVGLFRDYGYRRLRNRARIKFLIADWGAEKFREVLEREYLKRELVDGPAPEHWTGPRDHIGVHKQVDGLNYVGAAAIAGRVSGTILTKVADAAERVGSRRVRLTVQQQLLVLDVPDEHVGQLTAELAELGLQVDPSPWRRHTMACTGIEFCKLAIVETKGRALTLVTELEERLADIPDLGTPIAIHLNGCPNACARTQTADIGLKGQIVTDDDGNQVPGFQVHLGGGLGLDAGFGRKVRGLKVTSAGLGDYVDRVVRNFVKQRDEGERFAQWVARADEADLG